MSSSKLAPIATCATCGHGRWAHFETGTACAAITSRSKNQCGVHERRCTCTAYTAKEN